MIPNIDNELVTLSNTIESLDTSVKTLSNSVEALNKKLDKYTKQRPLKRITTDGETIT